MDKPAIRINGKAIEIQKTNVQVFREMLKLDAERGEIPMIDFIDRHCEVIALAFGVTRDEVYDNIDVRDIIPIHNDVLAYFLEQLTARFKKNEADEAAVQV